MDCKGENLSAEAYFKHKLRVRKKYIYVLEQNAGLQGGGTHLLLAGPLLHFLFLMPPGFLVPILIPTIP